ncbi:6cc141cd-8360-46e1-abea-0e25718e3aee [Sclerotinia trifoliorum]|uniref:6cc141cd-8360-46e1-abea-0e25718e3aee n=1 Tax=Sclerotinia trifoliorum TaxID=28548 RepID=A0A8H2VNR5_9HELO|nr:6cc141cd-8360-46e1-abea-0e25718e3aee [Sclerotinia trifoliorum]
MSEYVPPLQDAASTSSRTRNGENRNDTVSQAITSWPAAVTDRKESCPICFDIITGTAPGKDDKINMEIQLASSKFCWPEWPVITPCKHRFGSVCLGRWLLHSDSCPLCRTKLVSHQTTSMHIYDQPIQRAHSLGALDIFREPSYTTGTDVQDMNYIQTVLSRSTSSGNGRSMDEFERQRLNTRMGGLAYVDPRNIARARSNWWTIQAHIPPATTTTHGHPDTPTSVERTPEYTRRTYENVNITSYELRNQANSNTQLTDRTREAINTRWRNLDFLNNNRRPLEPITIGTRNAYSVADVVGLAMGVGTVVGMPRGERTIPRGRERTIPAGEEPSVPFTRESSSSYSIINAMSQALGVGTVFAMPRAEWRNSNHRRRRNNSPSESIRNISINNQEPREMIRTNEETRTTEDPMTRRRENSTPAHDLSDLPGLASSMWARPWG